MIIDSIIRGIAGLVYCAIVNSGSSTGKKVIDSASSEVQKYNDNVKDIVKRKVKECSTEQLNSMMQKSDLEEWQRKIIQTELDRR